MADQTRRELLKATAGAVMSTPLIAQGAGAATTEKALRFFTPEEFRMVDDLTEMIIPADDHSPGARAAQVASYLDRRAAESFLEEPKREWREGLQRVNALSQEMHGHPFLEATAEQRVAVLTRMAQNERAPTKPEEIFFRELKQHTASAYYSSKIGIHTEMEYKGNTYLKEFVGYDAK